MTEHIDKSTIRDSERSFPSSWIDRLIAWIDRLPGPAWLFYVLSTVAIAFLGNAVLWIDGSMPFGSVDRLTTIFAISVFYWLALYHYLTIIGSRSLQTFRPMLEVDDFEVARVDDELAKLPPRLGWLAVPLGLALAALTVFGDPAPFGEIVPRTALPYVGDFVITGFLSAAFFCVVIRSIRQLRMVGKLHTRATNINLLKLEPAHAFSTLTARTGIGIILLLIFAYFLDPAGFGTALDIFFMGMRDHLEEEKQRVLNETSDLLQMTSTSFHSKINNRDFDELGGMETAISALIRERELLENIPTWPWDTRTIRGFVSALLLPIFLWFVTRLLERFV
jgi:hypothetical protein